MNQYSMYENALTDDLLDRCDGPVNVDVLTARVTGAIKEGKYSPEEIAQAAFEALHILKEHDGYIPSNEFRKAY